MPGAPLGNVVPSFQDAPGQGVPSVSTEAAGNTTTFLVWLVVLGIIVPVLILGGLRAGGFQFVYRRRG